MREIVYPAEIVYSAEIIYPAENSLGNNPPEISTVQKV